MSRKSGKTEGRSGSRARARSKTPRSTPRLRLYTPTPPEPAQDAEGNVSPLELYRVEKARRARAMSDDSRLEEAKAEYQALLAADAAKGKGGRPRKKAGPAVAPAAAVHGDTFNHAEDADDVELDTTDDVEVEAASAEDSEHEEHDEAS